MDLKKKLKRFFTLTRKANDGFTLVELIVVIAILAILAGVGSVGYAGYIKSANKGADKTLVGNVMRAIETGTNSYAFVNGDSFKMGQMSYPVGFVTLSAEGGAQVVASNTQINNGTSGECDIREIEICYPTFTNVRSNNDERFKCEYGASKTLKVYSLATKTVLCCVTHSEFVDTTGGYITEFATSYSHTHQTFSLGSLTMCSSSTWTPNEFLTVPDGVSNFVLDESKLYSQSTDTGLCEIAYANQNGTFLEPDIDVTKEGALYDSLVAAFGTDLSVLKLKYDGWSSEEGTDFATFYLSAPELMEDMEYLTGLLASASKLGGTSVLGLSQSYDNKEEVLSAVSGNVVGTHTTEDSWMNAWNRAAAESWSSYGFELTGRENYSAARMAYNNAFASYVDSMDSTISDDCLEKIKNFYSQSARDYNIPVDLGLPGLVNTSAFTDENSGLKQAFIDAGDTTAGEKDSAFNKCAALYEKYKNSPACAENGKLVYNTLATFDQTSDVANAYADMYGGTIYDYYNNYVNEINALYEKAQEAAGDGIVIVVTVEKGLLNFQVSPNAANPRLD